MNEQGRELLIAAALRGYPQSFKYLHDVKGDCAVGILHRTFHDDKTIAGFCLHPYSEVSSRYDIPLFSKGDVVCSECGRLETNEMSLIVHLNDDHHMDFLTIARKIP